MVPVSARIQPVTTMKVDPSGNAVKNLAHSGSSILDHDSSFGRNRSGSEVQKESTNVAKMPSTLSLEFNHTSRSEVLKKPQITKNNVKDLDGDNSPIDVVQNDSLLTSPRRMTRLREDEESKEDDNDKVDSYADADASASLEMDWMLGSEPRSRESGGRR